MGFEPTRPIWVSGFLAHGIKDLEAAAIPLSDPGTGGIGVSHG